VSLTNRERFSALVEHKSPVVLSWLMAFFNERVARSLLGEKMTLVGGINALTLASGSREHIREEVRRAVDILGQTRRFILHPVDSLFPDTPWPGLEALIEAWREAWG